MPHSKEEHLVRSASGEYERKVWASIGEAGRLCVFLDAEFYVNRMDVTPILAGRACIFVSHQDGETRHYDYTCNPRYASFIAEEVVAWAHEKFGIPLNGNVICGLSLSGLAATHMAFLYPDTFPSCLSQSGSYWWNEEWLTSQVQASVGGQFWLSVGDREADKGISHPPTGLRQEVSQIDSVNRMADALQGAGATVSFRTFDGGHEMAPWEAELPEAMAWLAKT